MSSGEQLTVALVALYIVKQLIEWLFSFTRGQQKQEAVEAAERGRWMTMLETVLDKQQNKFKELADIFKGGVSEAVEAMQTHQDAALEQLVKLMDERMGKVTTGHITKLDLIDANIKVVPAEVRRVLADDFTAQTTAIQNAIGATSESHQDVIREAISSALKPLLEQIEEKIDQMPGAETARAIIRAEIGSLQQQLVDQVAEQITPLFDKLSEIAATLDKLQPPTETKESGEQTPADTSTKGENNYVGNPS